MITELLAILVIGFFSGFHCAGMCGPIVYVTAQPIQIALPVARSRRVIRNLVTQSWYHFGRIISYMTLGSIAGLLGASFFAIAGLQTAFSFILGALVLMAGLGYMGLFPRVSESWFSGLISRAKVWLQESNDRNSMESRLLLGLLTPLLPCGILYGMVVESASTGSIVVGALHMGVFALGTIPALFGLGALIAGSQGALRKYGPKLAGVLLVVMGSLTIARGFGVNVLIPIEPKKIQCSTCTTK